MKKCKIFYFTLTDEMRKEEKLDWFAYNKIDKIPFEHITPDKNNNWLDLTDNDWNELIPVIDKNVKLNKSQKAIFRNFFPGVPTNRDEWVYDMNVDNLLLKMEYFSNIYNKSIEDGRLDYSIKWSRDLTNEFNRKNFSVFSKDYVNISIYRPYTTKIQYSEKLVNDVLTQNHYNVFGVNLNKMNFVISIPGVGIDRPFHTLSIKYIPHLQITPNGQNISLFTYDTDGNRIDNITDWGLEQFRNRYEMTDPQSPNPDPRITKEDIFHYVYGVLHNPEYRKKYEMNLKREFPRVPFYDDFWQWASWGRELMDLHINFETVEPYPLEVIEQEFTYDREPKAKLKADKTAGTITLDEITTLAGIPSEVWEYKLGNRSALEWILDQYKEKKPKDPTIAEKFNTYRFADYKSKVTDLLMRVTTVSVETVRIVKEMEK